MIWFFVHFTYRVQLACNQALLQMFQIDYVGNAPYHSCIPYVVLHRLSSSDRFLALSSDGLYQYFSNEEVVAHVTWFMENALKVTLLNTWLQSFYSVLPKGMEWIFTNCSTYHMEIGVNITTMFRLWWFH